MSLFKKEEKEEENLKEKDNKNINKIMGTEGEDYFFTVGEENN